MIDPRRYRRRPDAVGLTRRHLLLVAIAVLSALAGAVLGLLGSIDAVWAGLLLSLAGATLSITALLTRAHEQPPPRR